MPETPKAEEISSPVVSNPVQPVGAVGSVGGGTAPLPFNPVHGTSAESPGVTGESTTNSAVLALSLSGPGVTGSSGTGIGVVGYSETGAAIVAQGNAVGPGLIALGNYEIDSGASSAPAMEVLPTALTDLINANRGFAALLSGDVLVSGALKGASASFSGALEGAAASFSGALESASATFSGALKGASASFSGALEGGSAAIGGEITATTAKFSAAASFAADVTISGALVSASAAIGGAITANTVTSIGDIEAQGHVNVKGDIFLIGADCAEQFDLHEQETAEPGTVMVIDEAGALRACSKAYDRAVAGVVSGAGAFRPGIVLDRQEGPRSRANIALVGKVYCKVDADIAPIAVGDLLTPSDRPGHAMKVIDPSKGFGAVIGKALRPMAGGRGLLPILVALQ